MEKTAVKRKRKVVYARDFVLRKDHVETPVGVSETRPDESFSIRELLERAVEGSGFRSSPGAFDPAASFDSVDLEKVAGMDIYERDMFLSQVREAVKFATDAVEADRKRREALEKEEKDLDQEIRSKFKEERQKKGQTGQRQDPADTGGKQGGPKPERSGAE